MPSHNDNNAPSITRGNAPMDAKTVMPYLILSLNCASGIAFWIFRDFLLGPSEDTDFLAGVSATFMILGGIVAFFVLKKAYTKR